jgi:septal ring factor EnvC (AmiA/AmiB activator)
LINIKNIITIFIISNHNILKYIISLLFTFIFFQSEIKADLLKEDHASLIIPENLEHEKKMKSSTQSIEKDKISKFQNNNDLSNLSNSNPIGDKGVIKKTFSLDPNNPHKGVLISGKTSSVSAWDNGKVIAIDHLEGYDTVVIIQHKDNILSVYGKLKEVFVTEGETLLKGNMVGISSSVSGLYFQVNQQGKPLNPHFFIR